MGSLRPVFIFLNKVGKAKKKKKKKMITTVNFIMYILLQFLKIKKKSEY